MNATATKNKIISFAKNALVGILVVLSLLITLFHYFTEEVTGGWDKEEAEQGRLVPKYPPTIVTFMIIFVLLAIIYIVFPFKMGTRSKIMVHLLFFHIIYWGGVYWAAVLY
tara:strand:- start:121 stop:453 length:333 start_codon:yes stop_codon:yes gene_type:complete